MEPEWLDLGAISLRYCPLTHRADRTSVQERYGQAKSDKRITDVLHTVLANELSPFSFVVGFPLEKIAYKDYQPTTHDRPLATKVQEHNPVDMAANNKNNTKQWTCSWRWQRHQCKIRKK